MAPNGEADSIVSASGELASEEKVHEKGTSVDCWTTATCRYGGKTWQDIFLPAMRPQFNSEETAPSPELEPGSKVRLGMVAHISAGLEWSVYSSSTRGSDTVSHPHLRRLRRVGMWSLLRGALVLACMEGY